ncbi:neurochondrin [Xiphophorus maculatus]|uniref:Neurochondrin n=1 Tax=Xiphophorus maculatus TaxID=8083 RepID=A0A3B5RER9_XIPMA|nr:neurochondrin [Xiphophorus maculatus]XP_023200191.1 neurochondrin [Xiphophorus maculatus]
MGDQAAEEEEQGAAGGRCLSEAQTQVLDRCLHALRHAKNDSQTLAALMLITRLCPASQLDPATMRRVFEAVGPALPARLLVTALRDAGGAGLPPQELLSLGSALLAALSTDPNMAARPQLLATVPLLLGLLADGPGSQQQNRAEAGPEARPGGSGGEGDESRRSEVKSLDEAVVADCFQVLTAVLGLLRGPERLLARGAVPALCRASGQNCCHQRALSLLGCLLSRTREEAWRKHPAELLSLLLRLCSEFCRASDQTRLQMCAQLVRFLPPPEAALQSAELREAVGRVWAALRPTLQAKLTPKQIGPVLVLSACLLDLYGWESVGPARFCCLLVNRACVEVRMGLEEPPGNDPSPELQNTLTGCYRIMEAAMEQACTAGAAGATAPPHCSALSALSLQQSRQVLEVLQEAFSAVIFYLQQVESDRFSDPFVLATFRALCAWLAEETSCLKEEVTALLPFLIGYARRHLQEGAAEPSLSDWTARLSFSEGGGAWTGTGALRYLLPALCHLSAEDAPRKVLLSVDAPALLVDFLIRTWTDLRGRSLTALPRDPSMETACSALLNVMVTEPDSVRKDLCFRALEVHLSEALPVLMNKPRLLVLAANYCTLGLMIGRLKAPTGGPVDSGQRRFFSVTLRFLRGALRPGSGSGPVQVSADWEESWDEAAELWRLSLQALGGCVRAQPWLSGLIRDEGWLRHTVGVLTQSGAAPERHSQEALEEALCAVAERCPDCRREVREAMRSGGALGRMKRLKAAVGLKD